MSDKKNILVTGANGQVGMEFRELASSYPQYNFHFVSRKELDITSVEQLQDTFSRHHFEFCINCAAYTAVDKAESDRAAAMLINGTGAGQLAMVCNEHKTRLVHISTDYVFDGTACTPYTEDAKTNPVNFYGESKLAGELQILKHDPLAIIIRTSWVYSFYGNNFVKSMIRLMGQHETIGVVNDQWGCPTYACDLAEAIMTIIDHVKVPGLQIQHPAIFHFCNNARITWFDFATAIKEIINSNCSVYPISSSEYKTAAKRPAYSVMDTRKIKRAFGIQMQDWRESLKKCIGKYGN